MKCSAEKKSVKKGIVLPLKKLIGYAPGAIVSKTLLDNKAGTITLFAFARGQGLSEHSAPYDAVVQIIEGRAEIRVGGVPHELSEGEMIIMPANIPHAVQTLTKFKMLLTMIRGK